MLRYAYLFEQLEITKAIQALFGLSNVQLQDPIVIADAIEWHQNGMDFVDAIHLAQSKKSEALVTFDKKFIKSASKNTSFPVREP